MIYANVLTGGICCGKSSVANLLKLEGYKIIFADEISHICLEEAKNIVVDHFGEGIVVDGKIHRGKLGELVFKDKDKLMLLESILHPRIAEKINIACEQLDELKAPYFVEIPLFFESKYKYRHKFVICVYAPKQTQLQRLMKRNNLDEYQASQRINAQIDIEIKKEKSDFIINNSQDLKSMQKNLNLFLIDFQKFYEKPLN